MKPAGIKKDEYDVVIVGAGIGGLVCGCYLAKAGLKVLIAEQHDKPGGYCTSFKRDGFTFDVGVHYLGSCREGGITHGILKDLELLDRIKFLRSDPCDRFILPDRVIRIRQDKQKTKQELIGNFPKEKDSLDNFFQFVLNADFLTLAAKTRKISFAQLLDSFFKDKKLKAVLSIPMGNLGLPPSKASALAALMLYKEYILDGGYYPQGGIQRFPNLLATRFKEFGGEILFLTPVKEIKVIDKKIRGVALNNGFFIKSKYVVSNADAKSTFNKLISIETKEKEIIKKLVPSSSGFVLYLGLDSDLRKTLEKHYVTWQFSTYDIERCYDTEKYFNFKKYQNKNENFEIPYVICQLPFLVDDSLTPKNMSLVHAAVLLRYANKDLWNRFREKVISQILVRLNAIMPGIENSIRIKEMACPSTFHKFTSNYNGSIFGWAAEVDQIDRAIFPSQSTIQNLYLTGHWVTSGVGQSGVTLVGMGGQVTAKSILKKVFN